MIARKSSGGKPITQTINHPSFMTKGPTCDLVSFRCFIIAKTKTQNTLKVLMKLQGPLRLNKLIRPRVTAPSSAP